jgi:hypothetical protein
MLIWGDQLHKHMDIHPIHRILKKFTTKPKVLFQLCDFAIVGRDFFFVLR